MCIRIIANIFLSDLKRIYHFAIKSIEEYFYFAPPKMAIPCEQPKAALLSFLLTHPKLFHVKQARRQKAPGLFFAVKNS